MAFLNKIFRRNSKISERSKKVTYGFDVTVMVDDVRERFWTHAIDSEEEAMKFRQETRAILLKAMTSKQPAEFDDRLVIDGARISWFWLGNVKRD